VLHPRDGGFNIVAALGFGFHACILSENPRIAGNP
jgi:hypothetical protein